MHVMSMCCIYWQKIAPLTLRNKESTLRHIYPVVSKLEEKQDNIYTGRTCISEKKEIRKEHIHTLEEKYFT